MERRDCCDALRQTWFIVIGSGIWRSIDAGRRQDDHENMSDTAIASQMLPRLYEDDHYVFLAKPAGLSVRSPRRGVAWGVVEAVELLGDGGGSRGLRECYRLDRYTSGVLGLAKSETAAERFTELATNGGVTAHFAAVVRRKERKSSRSVSNSPRAGQSTTGSVSSRADNIQVQVLEQFGDRATVRVICQHLHGQKARAALRDDQSPILGDVKFALRTDRRQAGRFYLHLERVEFVHPFSSKRINLTARVPDSFGAAVRVGAGDSKIPPAKARGARSSRGPTPTTQQPDKIISGHLEVALASRVPFLLDDNTNAYRLFSGRSDGISGLIAEQYADVVIIQTLQGKFDGGDQAIRSIAEWYGERLGIRAVYYKNIPHDRSGPRRTAPEATGGKEASDADSTQKPEPLWGSLTNPEIMVTENASRFLIRPNDGYLSGLFLDQRDNRKIIRELAGGCTVLNLFSYTCSFSVAAAIGGAKLTASVDVSKKSLERGKQNFLANDISLDDHKFFCSDVFEYFKRAHRQEQRFDVIVVDPPAFGRSKKPPRTFQVIKDMEKLIEGSASLLNSGGHMLVSTNERSVSTRWIQEKLALAVGRRTFKVTGTPDAPPDFAGSTDAAKSIWVRF